VHLLDNNNFILIKMHGRTIKKECMYIYDNISLNSSQEEKKKFQTKGVEKIKTHILCTITLFWKSCHMWDNVEKYFELWHPRCGFRLILLLYTVEKYGTAWQATDDNTVHAG
jgi:hypothetical protein